MAAVSIVSHTFPLHYIFEANIIGVNVYKYIYLNVFI